MRTIAEPWRAGGADDVETASDPLCVAQPAMKSAKTTQIALDIFIARTLFTGT